VKQFFLILAFIISMEPTQTAKGNELSLAVCHQPNRSVVAISYSFLNPPRAEG